MNIIFSIYGFPRITHSGGVTVRVEYPVWTHLRATDYSFVSGNQTPGLCISTSITVMLLILQETQVLAGHPNRDDTGSWGRRTILHNKTKQSTERHILLIQRLRIVFAGHSATGWNVRMARRVNVWYNRHLSKKYYSIMLCNRVSVTGSLPGLLSVWSIVILPANISKWLPFTQELGMANATMTRISLWKVASW
jgi:hypothetical protein